MAPTGKAVDVAVRDAGGDEGLTIAKTLQLLRDNQLELGPRTMVIVDEAAMVGTGDLHQLLTATTQAGTKTVLVGDAYQLSPVKARGGMFEQLCADLPWSQRLGEVWRMQDPEERDTSLALRAARGNRLRNAVKWYRDNGRLHDGDPIAMAADAPDAYLNDRAAIDPDTNRLAAERVTDKARAVFDGDYLNDHITLGYAATVHSAQGVIADSSYAILGEGASRAMAYVAMSRGRRNNEAFLYQRVGQEADHEHAKPVSSPAIHQLRRGNKSFAEHYFKQLLHNDDRSRTMHAEAQRSDPALLPDVVAEVIQPNEGRRRTRMATWRAHVKTEHAWRAGRERMAAAAQTHAAGVDLDAGGIEL
jgi:AAA domain